MYEKSLFVFRRDLRLNDNTGLIQALKRSKVVIPIFIFDDFFKASKVSKLRKKFLDDSILDLNLQLEKQDSALQIFKGRPKEVLKKIIENNDIESVFVNTDFTNYSKNRDKGIYKICKSNKIDFCSYLDFLLHNPNEIKTNENNPYTVYSQFYKKVKQFPVKKIQKNLNKNYFKDNISECSLPVSDKLNYGIPGGRYCGLKILKNIEKFKPYVKFRDFPSLNFTTKLSAHSRFGTLSIREIYYHIQKKLGPDHPLIGEIYWREFFNYVHFHFPWSTKKTFKKKFQKIKWSKSVSIFRAWCEGKTGFPIVDAGMRQLNESGFMHNRVRMLVASFLTKDLHLDWRMGERYFAKKLIDYDPAVNSGNWQWAASTGCDSVPYFRIFNPWLQQEKFDKNCLYIKKWVPELEKLSPEIIHNLWKNFPNNLEYPKPIVDHKIEAKKTKEIFKEQNLLL